MGLNVEGDVWRCNYCGESGGMLALYAKVYGISNSEAYRRICDALQTGDFAPEYRPQGRGSTSKEIPQSEQASAQEIHRTLSAMLSMLALTPVHREHLRIKRGLTDAQIDRFGFKSTPPPLLCGTITKRLMEQGYPGGFILREFHAKRIYRAGNYRTPEIACFERCRTIVDQNMKSRNYYIGVYKQKDYRWIKGEPEDSYYGYGYYYGRKKGRVYGQCH